ncbi:MAG: response regulator transcription factor [Bacteroidetes bacterium]|nr:response regulator transcription factor [Bacteroidota bacterium]
MINIVIIEDEKISQDKLRDTLNALEFDINIAAVLSSVKDSISYFKNNTGADLILSDVQLSDGLSFDIFRETGIDIPVIFITGFDKFMLYAFESNGIDYLLKPVEKEELSKAILKYKMFEQHFINQQKPMHNLLALTNPKKKSRLIVKKGIENVSLKLEDIILFYTENKIVYLVDKFEKKYIVDKTLNDLELELDNAIFFRANRQYIINLNFVKCFKAYNKVKLQVDLNLTERNHSIIISQLTAPYFRKWISEA